MAHLYKHKVKFLPAFLVIAMIFGVILSNVSFAASITSMTDTMTNQTKSLDSGHTVVFTLGTALTSGDGILVTFDNAGNNFDFTSVATTDFSFSCATGTITTSTEQVGDVSAATSGTDEIGLEITDIGTCSGVVTLTADGTNKINNPGTAGSYTIAIRTFDLGTDNAFGGTSGAADTEVDLGSLAVAILDDSTVDVTATVDPSITFNIRNSADTADTASCSLGTLSTGSVSTCAYRLAVDTNATAGYTLYVSADAVLNTAGGDTIDDITEDTTVSTGTEGHGVAITGATTGGATGATYTENGNFSDDDTPVPTTSTALFSIDKPADYTALTLTSSTLVTHRAAISAVTAAGSYDQVVSYTVVGNF